LQRERRFSRSCMNFACMPIRVNDTRR
jgi:hypothetical protein